MSDETYSGPAVEIAELRSPNHPYPVAFVRRTGEAPNPLPPEPKMWYVWAFEYHLTDYVPVAVFNSRAEAEAHRDSLEEASKSRGFSTLAWAVLELSFRQFIEMAVDARLGALAEPIRKLAGLPPLTDPITPTS